MAEKHKWGESGGVFKEIFCIYMGRESGGWGWVGSYLPPLPLLCIEEEALGELQGGGGEGRHTHTE